MSATKSPYEAGASALKPARRPNTAPQPGGRRRRHRKKPPTPGPGSYDLDTSKGAIGQAGFAKEAAPRFSFGTSDRFAYMGQYVSKRHSKSSSFFGRHSPGPATYNTRSGAGGKTFSFGSDINRPSAFKVPEHFPCGGHRHPHGVT
jgi:hypothetical protein